MQKPLSVKRTFLRVAAERQVKELGLADHAIGRLYVSLNDYYDRSDSYAVRIIFSREIRQVLSQMREECAVIKSNAPPDKESFLEKGRRDFNIPASVE